MSYRKTSRCCTENVTCSQLVFKCPAKKADLTFKHERTKLGRFTINNMNILPVQHEKEDLELEPKSMPYPFEKELIVNQNKHCHVFKEFTPSRRVQPIDFKSYARHEQKKPNFEKYLRFTTLNQRDRRTQLGLPRLQSQIHGWLPEILEQQRAKIMQDLNFINTPKQRCEMTIHGEKLCSERITERPDFNGLRFLLHHRPL